MNPSGKFLCLIILLAFSMIFSSDFLLAEENKIPDWIKNNAGWWSEGQISDSEITSPQNQNSGPILFDGRAEIHNMESGDVYSWTDAEGDIHLLIYCSHTLVSITANQVAGGCQGLTQEAISRSRVYFRSDSYPDFY